MKRRGCMRSRLHFVVTTMLKFETCNGGRCIINKWDSGPIGCLWSIPFSDISHLRESTSSWTDKLVGPVVIEGESVEIR